MNLLECMILCAGRGERLRPLTEVCPKPMIPVLGVTLADRALAACELLAPTRRMANAHHLPEQIMAWAEARVLDHVQVEAVLLDTGGALSLAANEKELHSEHLLVHNGDILHDLDLRKPWEAHIASKADVTLVVVDRERINTVLSRDTGFVGVAGHARTPESSLTDSVRSTFTGIAFYRTSVLKGLARGAWSVKELWFDLLEQGKNVQVWFAPDDCLWEDCGTPEDLARVTRDELQRRHLSQWIDPSAQVHPESRLSPLSVAEFGTRLYRGAVLEDSIVLPGGEVGPHEVLHRVIRNPGGDVKW